ncbi:hypothetical protein [Subtercola lobariae]|uniref:Uncharacterized protein n=1 Tax=Subtercola lobariae TaxID=1588641 RepID=A0A917B351_9MICO|nr:hypothetical protein [Subtercola lobariae]GGF18196.1 hypothetical protein GCM10011399_09870 [Subtercola lobariae]
MAKEYYEVECMVGSCTHPVQRELIVSHRPALVVFGVCDCHFEIILQSGFVEESMDPTRGLISITNEQY